MIITFSGTDGVGKSTQLFKAMDFLKSRGIDFRVQYVRGGNTPVIQTYRKAVSIMFRRRLPDSKIIRAIGIAIAWMELAYCWGIQLRLFNKPDRFVLCDRYLWDTYADIKCKYPEWSGNSLLWKVLEKLAPAPDASILYTTSAEQIAERLRKKAENFSLSEIENALEQYLYLQNRFDCVVDSSEDPNAVFEQTISLVKDLVQRSKTDRYHKHIIAVAEQTCGTEALVTAYRVTKGNSNVANYCISCNREPMYFAKIHKGRITGASVINALHAYSRSFTKVVADIPVGYRQRCLITDWVNGREISCTMDEAQQVAGILKMLHSASVVDNERHMDPSLEMLRYMTYIRTRRVQFPHKREILQYLKQNKHLHRSIYALTHMDVHCGNFMTDDVGRVYLIDYENMCITDPWRDFVYAAFFHPKSEDAFWRQVLLEYFDFQIPDDFWYIIKYYSCIQFLRMIICEHQKENQNQINFLAEKIWPVLDIH
jgi:dTMP kinase